MTSLREAVTPADIATCFDVMRELRPHLTSADDLAARVYRQTAQGYTLAGAFDDDRCVGCVGFRMQDNLVHGHHVYVDDLVVATAHRRGRLGERLLRYACDAARRAGCAKVLLDTPTANVLGHRFYYRLGMTFTAMRFSLEL
jgi:ribosomal protein S18 acetylase RimI-like enzyme